MHTRWRRAWTIAALVGGMAAAATAREPGDPSSRLPDTGSASEYWDLWTQFDSGERIFARFLITNEGPGDHAGVTIGHVVRADGSVVPFRKGKLEGHWSLSDDGRRVKVGKSVLDQSAPVNRFWFESEKQGVEIELEFVPTGPATSSNGSGPAGYATDVLELGVPVSGWYRVAEMSERRSVRGMLALTHTWTANSEADIVQRRIEFLSLGEGAALYLSQLTAPDGTQSSWLAVREDGRILYRSEDFDVTVGKPTPTADDGDYPLPSSLRIRNASLAGEIRLANVMVRHDLFEALPLPFRLWLSFRMRPHRVWTESTYEVKLKPEPESPPLMLRGTGITSVTFLNPVTSPV